MRDAQTNLQTTTSGIHFVVSSTQHYVQGKLKVPTSCYRWLSPPLHPICVSIFIVGAIFSLNKLRRWMRMRMRSRRKDNFPCQFVNVTFTFTITHHVHGESGRMRRRRQKKLLHYQLGEMTLLHVAINRPFNSRQIRNCSYFSSSAHWQYKTGSLLSSGGRRVLCRQIMSLYWCHWVRVSVGRLLLKSAASYLPPRLVCHGRRQKWSNFGWPLLD